MSQFLTALVVVLVVASQCFASEENLGTIIFSSVLFRHGDRAPFEFYPNDPYNDVARYWPRGYGQLTEIGEEQHYRLGSYLRQRYSDLLPLTYNYNDTHVRSTDVDRALASALCNLAGLYPVTKPIEHRSSIMFQAIPIHTESQANDHVLQPQHSCPKYDTILSYLRESKEYSCVMNVTSVAQKEIAEFAGYSSFTSDIYDTLFIEELYNFTLPKWVWDYYPKPLKNIYMLHDFIAPSATTELQRLFSGPMLKEIIENMQSKLKGTLSPDRSLYVYSAHDTNVANTLQALKVFNGLVVPYASAVIIELRELNNNHYVTVSFKNSTDKDSFLLQLPGCDSLCPLDKFVELTKDVIPEDLDSECAESVEPETEYVFQIPAAAILPEWEHCFEDPKSDDGLFYYVSLSSSSK